MVREILPRNERPDRVVADVVVRNTEPDITPARGSMRQILKGVRFKGSSAPGASGRRPEHLPDALSARPRSSASRLLVALNEFYYFCAR